MADSHRARLAENAALSAAIGFMALILAAASIFAESSSASAERAAIAKAAGGPVSGGPARFDDPAFSRVYPVGGGSRAFASVLRLPAGAGIVRAVVLFKRDGAPISIEPIGGGAAPAWLAGILGAAPQARPSREIAACEEAIARASRAVASIPEARR